MARGRPRRSSRDHCWPFIVGPGEHPDRHEVGVFGAAQWLYRAHGFRLAGLRRGYYRDNGEDALVLEWRAGA